MVRVGGLPRLSSLPLPLQLSSLINSFSPSSFHRHTHLTHFLPHSLPWSPSLGEEFLLGMIRVAILGYNMDAVTILSPQGDQNDLLKMHIDHVELLLKALRTSPCI